MCLYVKEIKRKTCTTHTLSPSFPYPTPRYGALGIGAVMAIAITLLLVTVVSQRQHIKW